MDDPIDRMIDCWQRELPDLDAAPLHLVGRVLVLARHLERRVNQRLAAHGLNLGLFDILATLRRAGPNGRMTPTQLSHSIMLSTGGMTNRLDRLESAGWVQRHSDPDDRRGTLIGLTPAGQQLIEAAARTRFEEAAESLPELGPRPRKAMVAALRKWLVQLTEDGG